MNATLDVLNRPHQKSPWGFLTICCFSLLLMAACTGCTQKEPSSQAINPVGEYTLTSVNGNEVPCTVEHQGQAMIVQSGTFSITADGTCSSRTTFSVGDSEPMTREVRATYTLDGAAMTLEWEGAGTTTGTLEPETFTMDNEGMIFVYRR
jgi:hypothetical protein